MSQNFTIVGLITLLLALRMTFISWCCSNLSLASEGVEGIRFPGDSGIVDVTKPPYNATPNDDRDDTQAIQKALDDNPSGNKIIYLPKGL